MSKTLLPHAMLLNEQQVSNEEQQIDSILQFYVQPYYSCSFAKLLRVAMETSIMTKSSILNSTGKAESLLFLPNEIKCSNDVKATTEPTETIQIPSHNLEPLFLSSIESPSKLVNWRRKSRISRAVVTGL